MITGKMLDGPLRASRMTFGNVVSIDISTGAIERLPGFTTNDAAALVFWEAVERLAPGRIGKGGGRPGSVCGTCGLRDRYAYCTLANCPGQSTPRPLADH